MKVAIAFIVVAFVAMVMAEDCPNNDPRRDCDHIECHGGYHKTCQNNICTCAMANGHACTMLSDCTSLGQCDRDWHCVDGMCRCGFNGGR